jgi:hypothetical protein
MEVAMVEQNSLGGSATRLPINQSLKRGVLLGCHRRPRRSCLRFGLGVIGGPLDRAAAPRQKFNRSFLSHIVVFSCELSRRLRMSLRGSRLSRLGIGKEIVLARLES